jgi:glyoxylase-like metal-dependent hydrolase (beta-lactamase superfamily II)
MQQSQEKLRFYRSEAPEFGQPIEIVPGILWLRLALPYALDHVNLYLFEEPGGWGLFDTGLGDDRSRETWQQVLAGPLGGKPITQLVVSHHHPDHVGLAGWFEERYAMRVSMTRVEYLFTRFLAQMRSPGQNRMLEQYFGQIGLSETESQNVLGDGLSYLSRVTLMDGGYHRLVQGDGLRLGGRDWRVLTGGGHSQDQMMLWCEADRLFLSADQVLSHISPNVSVYPIEPTDNPLGEYLASLGEIRATIPDDVLVLPGHRLPFHGLHLRAAELAQHHAGRCALIAAGCRERPLSCADLLPILFRRTLDAHQSGFALGEAQAHLNYMQSLGELAAKADAEGVIRYRSV